MPMIDWLTFVAPLEHDTGPFGPLFAGEIFSTIPDPTHPAGELPDWIVQKRLKLVSSWCTDMQVRSVDLAGRPGVQVSGCPAKFMQGHNIFGSCDLRGLVIELLTALCRARGLRPSLADVDDWIAGRIRLQRVDVTRSVDLASEPRVRAVLRAAERCGRLRHRGRGHAHDGLSVIFGKGSRRWSLTLYAKGPELSRPGHALPLDLPERERVTAHASGLLRQEVRLQSLELASLELSEVSAWTLGTSDSVLGAKLSGMELSEASLMAKELPGLPPKVQLVYVAWRGGLDLRAMFSRSAFYRHRAELLKHGVDIAVVQPTPEWAKPVDPEFAPGELRAILLGPEAPVPEWAKGTSLYFEPSPRGRLAGAQSAQAPEGHPRGVQGA